MSSRIKMLADVSQNTGDESFHFLASEKYIDSLKGLKGKNIIVENNLDDANNILKKTAELPNS